MHSILFSKVVPFLARPEVNRSQQIEGNVIGQPMLYDDLFWISEINVAKSGQDILGSIFRCLSKEISVSPFNFSGRYSV